jgi:hypothetical protein
MSETPFKRVFLEDGHFNIVLREDPSVLLGDVVAGDHGWKAYNADRVFRGDGTTSVQAAKILHAEYVKATSAYTPAGDRFTAMAADRDEDFAAFSTFHTDRLNKMTVAEILEAEAEALAKVNPVPKAKGEMITAAIEEMYTETAMHVVWLKLRREANREDDALERAEIADKALESHRLALGKAVEEGDLRAVDMLAQTVRREAMNVALWKQVAHLTGPDKLEPLQAVEAIVKEATIRALDDLEDNTQDMTNARIRARWIRRNAPLYEES